LDAIAIEDRVCADDRPIQRLGLSDQHPVERVAMMERELSGAESVIRGDRQSPKPPLQQKTAEVRDHGVRI
jgi:hypothetical protein